MPYIGNIPAEAYSQISYQDLTGGSGTSFTLDYPVGNENEIEVFVNNVRQEPTVAYTTAGTALTMTGTIAATDDFYVVFQGKAQQTVNPADSSITTAMIQSSAVTDAKIASGITASKLTGALPAIDGSALTGLPAGSVLQVVSTTKTDNFTTSNQSWTDVTGLSATITPASTSSKILAKAYVNIGGENNYYAIGRIERGGSALTANSGGTNGIAGMAAANNTENYAQYYMEAMVMEFLDSPSSTSALTYQVQLYSANSNASANTLYVNRPYDVANNVRGLGTSTITLMEIAQ